jgi:peptidoglycan/LPS O-acetylase OafA/YrhL
MPSPEPAAPETTAAGARVRIAYLDSLRGIAALIVAVFWHYQHFSSEYQAGSAALASAPFYHFPVIRLGYQYGQYSVDFFFILSGIIFVHVYWEAIGAGRCSMREYAVARFARLYPIHLATLLLIAPLLWAFHHATGRYPLYHHNSLSLFVINLLFLQGGFTHTRNSFNGPAWSLSVEAFLYCLFFVLARRQAAVRGPLLMFAIGSVILASGMNHAFLANSYIGRGLVGFALGMLIYRAGERPGRERILFAALVVATLTLGSLLYRGGWSHTAHIFGVCMFGASLMVIRRAEWLQKALEVKGLIVLGDISLTVYMIHVPLQCAILLAYQVLGYAIPYTSVWFLGTYASGVTTSAWLLHRYYEAPARAYLRRRLGSARNVDDRGRAVSHPRDDPRYARFRPPWRWPWRD